MQELIKKIKSTGYWKVILRPTVYDANLISSLPECKELITSNKVSLRGWPYPYIDPTGIKGHDSDSVYAACDWNEGPVFEYWRFYKTGQFTHLFAMREDIRGAYSKKDEFKMVYGEDVEKFLSILSTLYSVTEIFEFASRLFSKIEKVDSIELIIELHGVKNRMLIFWDAFNRFLNNAYICKFPEDIMKIQKVINKNELISKSSELALNTTMDIFINFNWDKVKKEIFIEDQKKFLERRL